MSGGKSRLSLVDAGEPPAGDYRLRAQIGFVLRKAHQRHVAIFAAQIGDLTPPQFAALAQLHEDGRTSQNQLGSLIGMDAATVKGVIDRLRARGLVELSRHEADKRRLMVGLSSEGRRTVEAMIPLARQATEDTLAPLNAREAETLARLLAKIA